MGLICPTWVVSEISAPVDEQTLWLPHASYTYFTTTLPFMSSVGDYEKIKTEKSRVEFLQKVGYRLIIDVFNKKRVQLPKSSYTPASLC